LIILLVKNLKKKNWMKADNLKCAFSHDELSGVCATVSLWQDQIRLLAQQGLPPDQIASETGLSLATVYRHLKLKKATPPPKHHHNRYRRHLAHLVWRLMVDEGLTRTQAAKRVLETEPPMTIRMASESIRPVTVRRLVDWSR
jgi:hypothetical protein